MGCKAMQYTSKLRLDGGLDIPYYKLGYNVDNNTISNFVETADGRYMCVWINDNLQLEVGYTTGKTFLTQNYAISDIITYSGITIGTKGEACTALYRRSDGQILVFLNDITKGALNTKTYKSANGLGTDIDYLNTIYTSTATGDTYAEGTNINPPCKLNNGRLVLTFSQVKKATWTMGCSVIAVSDDDGDSWIIKWAVGYLLQNMSFIGNCVQLKDGTLYTTLTDNEAYWHLAKSTDNGNTWNTIALPDNPFNRDVNLLFLEVANILFLYKSANNYLYQIINPTQSTVDNLNVELISTKLQIMAGNNGLSCGSIKLYNLMDNTLIGQYANGLSYTGEHRISEIPLHPVGIPERIRNIRHKGVVYSSWIRDRVTKYKLATSGLNTTGIYLTSDSSLDKDTLPTVITISSVGQQVSIPFGTGTLTATGTKSGPYLAVEGRIDMPSGNYYTFHWNAQTYGSDMLICQPYVLNYTGLGTGDIHFKTKNMTYDYVAFKKFTSDGTEVELIQRGNSGSPWDDICSESISPTWGRVNL